MTSFPNVLNVYNVLGDSAASGIGSAYEQWSKCSQRKPCSEVCPTPDNHKDIFKMML